jgi:2-amino-4-hydroxy-6-hydroxymethyldihydropteridine diphosphokinase
VAGCLPRGAKVVLSLGSNQGDSIGYLRRAVSWLREIPGLRLIASSSVYRTTPVDYLEQPDFLNAVVIGQCTLEPYTLLTFTQAIEARLGRVRVIDKGPRTIDIDIIAYDGHELRTPELTIPHPRAFQREFVMVPWVELDPDLTLRYPQFASAARRVRPQIDATGEAQGAQADMQAGTESGAQFGATDSAGMRTPQVVRTGFVIGGNKHTPPIVSTIGLLPG